MVNHLHIYQDFFAFNAPGAYYLLLGVWQIFGVSYGAAWMVGFFSLLTAAILVFKITRYFSRPAAYLATLIFSLSTIGWPIITARIFCLPLILGAIYATVLGTNRKQINFIYLAGFLGGLAVIFLQTSGLAILAVLLIFLLYQYFQKTSYLSKKRLVGFLFFSCLPIVAIFLKWTPVSLFYNLIKFPLFNYGATLTVSYWLLITIALFDLIFFLILNKYEKKSTIIKLLFFCQVALLLTAIPLPDISHILFISAPSLIMFSVLVCKLLKFKITRSWLGYFVIVLFFLYSFFLTFNFVRVFLNLNYYSLSLLYEPTDLIEFLNKNCQGKYIYAGPFLPSIYFDTRKLPPGPTSWLLTNHHPAEYFSATLKGLELTKPDCVVINYPMVKRFNYNRDNIVDNYLLNHYQQVEKFDYNVVLKPIFK